MTISIEHTAAAMNSTTNQDSAVYTNYGDSDALLEIARLREELWSKNTQIESLTETIVQMSIELANSKAKQDELSMQLRRASGTDDSLSKPTVSKQDRINSGFLLRIGSRRNTNNNNGYSKSIAVQNPSAQRQKPADVRRNKSETWATNGDLVEEIGDDNIRSKSAGFRGWGLETELDKTNSSIATSTSSTNNTLGMGLGSFVRKFSGSKSNESNSGSKNPLPSTPELHSPDTETENSTFTSKSSSAPRQAIRINNKQSHLIAGHNPSAQQRTSADDVSRQKSDTWALKKCTSNKGASKEETDSSALNSRRKPTKFRDINPGLKCPHIDFPGGSNDMLSGLFEENGQLSNGGNATRQPEKKNAEWSAM